MKRFEGKTALVTGSNRVIGLATAEAFANEGARLVMTGRDQATLDRARGALGVDCIAIRSDAAQVAAGRLWQTSEVAAGIKAQMPIKRFGTPKEIASAVLYLAGGRRHEPAVERSRRP
jgi:NAD(P)-dependent dehydrogenase (short-subunit alcohol dehydrogenase family)